MLDKLKSVLPEPIKGMYRQGRLSVLKWLYEFLRRILRRRMGLFFFSPGKALMTACSAPASQNKPVTLKSIIGERESTRGISIHENVISYPLATAESDNRPGSYFFGGLADPATQNLLDEAIHYNGAAYAQSLPSSYTKKWPLDNCLEIRKPVLYGGFMFNHFGHFILESLCRLYAYPMLREFDPFILFYAPWGLPRYLESNNFANQILSGFGIPVERLIFADQIARIKEIVIPPQKYGFGFADQPDELFVKFIRSYRFKHQFPEGMKGAEKVFVSRSRLQNRGRIIGENIFEKYLEKEGYSIFYPEQYTFYEQLTVYACAKKLIFSDGSSLLSCLFLSDLDAEVAVICRRREPQQNMSSTAVCLQGFGKNFLWIDAVRDQYQFGLETWNALAEIDWHEVSKVLLERDFVYKPFRILTDEDHLALVRSELRKYLKEISGKPQFIDHMMNLKEKYPPQSP